MNKRMPKENDENLHNHLIERVNIYFDMIRQGAMLYLKINYWF